MADSSREHDRPAGEQGDARAEADPRDLARKTADLARKAVQLQVLQRVSSEINSTLDLDEIYEIALRTMDELFQFHHANILLVEPGGETLLVVASRGYENQAIGGRVRIGTGVIGLVAQNRKMLHLSNIGQQRAYAAAQRRQMVKHGRADELRDAPPVPGLASAESQFAIPLLIRDELIGVFSIESPVRHSFSEHDRGLVSIVANQISSAIHNARLYEERRRAAEELKVANASLEARVAERTAALERELRVAEDLLVHARSRVDGPLLGESPAVRALRDAVAREASRTAPLLLAGPPGAGKEAVAHAVHVASGRRGAFIFVSCPELHTQNSLTPLSTTILRGESALLASKLELATGGTLFLDAVHELPIDLRRALRELLEGHRDGSSPGDGPLPARVIAATSRDLTREIQEPPDALLALLSRNRIAVPALADRREDIPALVDHFVRRHARQIGKAVDGVSPESMERLQAYAWPGNIRELRTVVERAVLISKSRILEIDEELLGEGLTAGSYRLVSLIGAGGMGEVWLARHRLLARPAAVKLIRHDLPPGAAHEQLVRRFEREAQVTAGLRSPHTVQLYDFGVNDSGSFFYVMELLEGLDLHNIVRRFGPQPAERLIMLLRQACRSLAEAHRHGLVHRDIKPANLFVTGLAPEFDYLKVLDFGIVKDRPEQDSMLTAQGMIQGTPAFMAPEFVFGDSPVDGRADLYSLACVAHWALTGQPLFIAKTPAEMLLHQVQSLPTPPSKISELPVPPAFEELLMACLEKDPAMRPASALELESELARVRCEDPWSEERARLWWEAHAPNLGAPRTA
jgi:DNA-binding NtrC family response regulator/putative methionine-R-sulfoxide reductase with GAF domain